MKTFATIHQVAARRKGGEAALRALLPEILPDTVLAKIGDDRFLAMMTRTINQAGFSWKVIERKWPQFEEAFLGFDTDKLSRLSQNAWEAYTDDKRVVRNRQKIQAVQDNLAFVRRIADQHGSFAQFIADWPASDQIGLLAFLKKEGARLGGQTGQWFLRYMQKDGFVLTRDVCAALRAAGVDMREIPSTKIEFRRIQDAFNRWHEESSLPYAHLSRIAACSVGTDGQQSEVPEELKAILPKDAELISVEQKG